jgi:muramidase (phage lysozyme)
MTTNEKAFLDMLAWSEIGAGLLAKSDDGYNVIVGSTVSHPDLFASYSDHPRKLVHFNNGLQPSTAAGRYQIKLSIFLAYTRILKLDGTFSKANQDKIAMQLIKECHAITDINSGNFESAVVKVKSRWASMPGAGYAGQHEQKMAPLKEAYLKAGGTLS